MKLQEVGFFGTIKLAKENIFNKKLSLYKKYEINIFDQKYGTDTGGIIKTWALDIPYDKAIYAKNYQPTGEIETIINMLNIQFDKYIFIDFGSGKGRVLLLASQFQFKEIIGVELSRKLHDIACNNIKIYKNKTQRCQSIRSIWEDAVKYDIPFENVVFYLYNPFDEYVIKEVLLNIYNSICQYPREVYIIYQNPIYRRLFDVANFLEIYKETEKYIIYKCKQLNLQKILPNVM